MVESESFVTGKELVNKLESKSAQESLVTVDCIEVYNKINHIIDKSMFILVNN